MDKLEDIVKTLFDNFGYFFGIDLLSFSIAGATCLGALVFAWVQLVGEKIYDGLMQGWGIVLILVTCYVLGMICFAAGRWIRVTLFERGQRWLRKITHYPKSSSRSNKFFLAVLRDHSLSQHELFQQYLLKDGSADCDPHGRLYTRLWTEVRQSQQLSASYTLLNRYWFMTGTYDGLATALMVWVAIVVVWMLGVGNPTHKLALFPGIILCGILMLLAITCWREADRYRQYQIEELVSTIAYQHSQSEPQDKNLSS